MPIADSNPAPAGEAIESCHSDVIARTLLNPSCHPGIIYQFELTLLVAHPRMGFHKTTQSDERPHHGRAVVLTFAHARRR